MATAAKIDEAKAELAAEKAYAAAAAQTEATAAPAPKAKVAAAKPVAKQSAAAKPAAPKKLTVSKLNLISQPKAKTMTKTTEDFTAKIKDAVTEAQDRAKTVFEKGQVAFAEAGEFTKGNVEALVESGKILAAGLQEAGKTYVAEGKTAFETATADVKAFAAVKSPTDFFKLQGEVLRRNFDAAVASGSKHSEAAVKLANDSFAPIQTRISLAVEKAKQAA